MPLIDMPLEKLRDYQGRNPRPTDFDDYWTRALAELKKTDPNVELKPASFQAEFASCHHLYFTGVNGARVHAKLVKPKQIQGKRPAIVQFHGYSGNSGDWTGLLANAARGYVVAALDCRGQGGLSDDAGSVRGNTLNGHIIRGLADHPDKLLFRDIFLDCAQLAGLVIDMPEVDPKRVGATGGSQGGALTYACAALEPRIARLAPLFPFLSDYKRVWEMDQAANAYQELKQFFRLFDPEHAREDEWWTRLGYIDIQHLAPRIRGEVLHGVGLMDAICPPSTQFAAYNKLTCPKSLAIYPDYAHETPPGWNDKVFQFLGGL